jgi:hypothetical protein
MRYFISHGGLFAYILTPDLFLRSFSMSANTNSTVASAAETKCSSVVIAGLCLNCRETNHQEFALWMEQYWSFLKSLFENDTHKSAA